ncbi:hypothetical protein [Aeromonas sp. R1-1]|uniref:hypothetical protein n=1 Tax=Aeromonas sp. R1-1 TaxID=3138455 RepID=UPI0034A3181D
MELFKILDTLAHNSLADNIGFSLAVLAMSIVLHFGVKSALRVINILTLAAK